MEGLPDDLPNLRALPTNLDVLDEDDTLVDAGQRLSEVLIQLLSPPYQRAFRGIFPLMNSQEKAIYNQIIGSLNPNQVEYTVQLLALNRLIRNIGQRIVTDAVSVRKSTSVTKAAALSLLPAPPTARPPRPAPLAAAPDSAL